MLTSRTFLIIGASGALGQAICRELAKHNAYIIAVARRQDKLLDLKRELGSIQIEPLDITRPSEYDRLGLQVDTIDGLIYTVGHCPPGGFEDAISLPLSSQASRERLRDEWEMQVAGLQSILAHALPLMKDDGRVITINSAMTRIPSFFHPSYMHDGYYTSAKMAQEQLVKRMRQNDPVVLEKRIQMSLIFPAAVDTLFHDGTDKGPPASVTPQQVAKTVLKAIRTPRARDYKIAPPLPKMIWNALVVKRLRNNPN